jgi:hypothetical protein
MTQSKEEALDILEATRSEFLFKARSIAMEVVKKKGVVSTDDIRMELDIPKGVDGRVMGAVFNTKEWVGVGYKKSEIKSSHRRPIVIFKLKNINQ